MVKKINVIIADDHAILRTGLRQILSETDDIAVIAEAQTANEAIKLCRSPEANVLLLDISLPDRSGLEALKYVKKENPHIAVLMLSMHREDQYAVRALKAGASGYLCKQSASSELVNAIHAIAKGRNTSLLLSQRFSQIRLEPRAVRHHMKCFRTGSSRR